MFSRKSAAIWLLLVLVGTVALTLLLPRNNDRMVVKTSDGTVIRLLEHYFKPGNTRYEYYEDSVVDRLVNLIPRAARKKFGIAPSIDVAMFPTNEPGLSVAFRPKFKSFVGLRLIVSDEHGNQFDEAAHNHGWRSVWVTEVRAFPRRRKEVRLSVADGTNVYPALVIPNPAPGPHPIWRANPLPVVSSDDNMEVRLLKFRTHPTGKSTFTKPRVFPQTELSFEVFENGNQTTNWRPVSIEVFDATGNHWKPWRLADSDTVDAGEIHSSFGGALWPGEAAWKLRVEFRKTGGFRQDELVRLNHVPIAAASVILEPGISGKLNTLPVEVLAVIGRGVKHDKIYHWNQRRMPGAMTVLIKGEILASNYRLDFVNAFDDLGQELKLVGELEQPAQMRGRQIIPYSLNFVPSNEAKEMTIIVGVTQSRRFEFLAKPDQVLIDE